MGGECYELTRTGHCQDRLHEALPQQLSRVVEEGTSYYVHICAEGSYVARVCGSVAFLTFQDDAVKIRMMKKQASPGLESLCSHLLSDGGCNFVAVG